MGMLGNTGPMRRFGRDTSGSVAIYAAAGLLVLFCAGGMAVDTARGLLLKSRLSDAADAAAMAGSQALLDTARRDDITRSFFAANLPADTMGATIAPPTITYANSDTEITVSATATLPTTMMRLIGMENLDVSASATALGDRQIGSWSNATN